MAELAQMSGQSSIVLYYGDESGVSREPCVPYAWQFPRELVLLPTAQGDDINCFTMLSCDNQCLAQTTQEVITGDYVAEQLYLLSLGLPRPKVVVFDKALIYHGRAICEYRDA